MNGFLELLYDVLFHPRSAMRIIAGRRLVGQSLAALLISVIIPTWATYMGMKTAGWDRLAGLISLVEVFGTLFVWFIGSAIWHLIAELFGGHGSAAGLMAAMGFARIPRIFLVPFGVIALLFSPGTGTLLVGAAGVSIVAWTLILLTLAIRESHQLSTAKAVLVLFSPLLALLLLAAGGIAYLTSAMIYLPLHIW